MELFRLIDEERQAAIALETAEKKLALHLSLADEAGRSPEEFESPYGWIAPYDELLDAASSAREALDSIHERMKIALRAFLEC